ncbi:Annexin A13 [Bulinus truncatus]|nr:Annexin A13 [Bulinus truncatus]
MRSTRSANLSAPGQANPTKAVNSFDPEKAAERLKHAMKGFGADEDEVIEILSRHNTAQRIEIAKKYQSRFEKDLRSDLESEFKLRPYFKDLALALLDDPRTFDARECNDAIKGAGTDEEALIEILSSKSNEEITLIKAKYEFLFKRKLEDDIKDDTSSHFKDLLVALVSGRREPERTVPDVALAKKEAMELIDAGEKGPDTKESAFNCVFSLRCNTQLRETFNQYKALSGKNIEKFIKSKMIGDHKLGCLAIVKIAINPAKYFAKSLYKSMKGVGTNDKTLIRIVVSRKEVDMESIKREFQDKFKKSLASFIEDDTSGDYKKLLIAIIEK